MLMNSTMLETRKFKNDTVPILKKIIIWLWSPPFHPHIPPTQDDRKHKNS